MDNVSAEAHERVVSVDPCAQISLAAGAEVNDISLGPRDDPRATVTGDSWVS